MVSGTQIRHTGEASPHQDAVLTDAAVAFVADLQRRFGPVREELLRTRVEEQSRIDAGGSLDFLAETSTLRAAAWSVSVAPHDLRDRRVEITGPTDRKMIINALNSGARVFMADFEDSNAPTWENMIEGQANLRDAVQRTITFAGPDGREYRLNDEVATLMVRPRGWHLSEKHMLVDENPVAASFFDFGLYIFHNAAALQQRGTNPYFYLAKLQSHREARLWSEVFARAEVVLGLEAGSVRATVLIETLPAAFQMEEILYELRDHSAGLNAGRWDYLFSSIKTFATRGDGVFPDRQRLTMTVPYMRAYTELLVRTCHSRGAQAIGGMAALIPNRRDAEATDLALAGVRADKRREAGDGFDGTWVAHPDLVAVAREEFDRILGERPNQVDRRRDDVHVSVSQLLDFDSAGHTVTATGLRNNVRVCLQYLTWWLGGSGAVGIFNLMEDVATAEIARSQIWQWLQRRATLEDGALVTPEMVRQIEAEELATFTAELAAQPAAIARVAQARALFESLVFAATFAEFLTIQAYTLLP